MHTKTCRQCGELKPLDMFRKYYGGRQGTYKTCKQCERINSREKYLSSKGELRNYAEHIELDNIHKLYDIQRRLGLQPPKKKAGTGSLQDTVTDMIGKLREVAKRVSAEVPEQTDTTDTPHELLLWLTKPLEHEPDYYLDEVYERLVDKYRPTTGIDTATMMPTYDDTHKAILDKILARFNEYEDKYYEGAEQ